jgi:hypothetical protein
MPDPVCLSAAKIRARYSCSLRVTACVLLGFSARPATARLIGTSYWDLTEFKQDFICRAQPEPSPAKSPRC